VVADGAFVDDVLVFSRIIETMSLSFDTGSGVVIKGAGLGGDAATSLNSEGVRVPGVAIFDDVEPLVFEVRGGLATERFTF